MISLAAIPVAFLLMSLLSFPLGHVGSVGRLAMAFLAWGSVLLLQTTIWAEDAAFSFWLIPYAAALGAYLGAGTRWWKKNGWRGGGGFDFHMMYARRITFRNQRSISSLVVKLGILSIALGVMVMEVSISIVYGFEGAIHDKAIGFSSHIHIGNLMADLDHNVEPLPRHNEPIELVARMPEVNRVTPYIFKEALLRSELAQEGIILKGVDSTYDWTFFEESLVEGRVPDVTKGKRYSKEILISRKQASLLDLKLNDKVFVYYFKQERPGVREFFVSGIYETGLGEFDLIHAYCDIRVPQEIWDWEPEEVSGFEVWLNEDVPLSELIPLSEEINAALPYEYESVPVNLEFQDLFDWVELQHQNVWFILGLMVGIAIINMISVILIMILERTRTIGLLKSLGMLSSRIQDMFVANALILILIGLAIGNLMAFSLLLSQDLLGWFTVDQESYFVNVVPVTWKWDWFLGMNFGVLCVCTFFMYLPTLIVSRISAVRALRFE